MCKFFTSSLRFYISPLRVRSIVISVFVCLSVCRSARISQKLHVQISPNSLYMLPVAVTGFASDGNTIRYVVDDVMFSYKRANGSESNDAYVSSSLPDDSTWGEVCCLGLHLVCLLVHKLQCLPDCWRNSTKENTNYIPLLPTPTAVAG